MSGEPEHTPAPTPRVSVPGRGTAVAITRSRGRWALWLVAGYVLVILFIVIGIVAMRGAPPWE